VLNGLNLLSHSSHGSTARRNLDSPNTRHTITATRRFAQKVDPL